ncbi:MAG: tRNA (adenosine(37)-N6)-dimethylallyltransferase MiaA [Balneolaceae bacterium]|nr:tRNA (adenosine(37)-N6)-dimethylallyltransferase MiaA [Balneolaceae bacterium]
MRIILLGPTAVGKTDLSLSLAETLNAEIISADSRQCYKYMNIGTATPGIEERRAIPHYNLSIIDPATKDSAANFYKRSQKWEKEIQERGKTPLFVGGSTLHVQCLIQPFDDIPDANQDNIDAIEERIEKEGIESLYKKLQKVDPEYAQEMDGMNTQRIVRALDVWKQTGRPFSSFHSNDGPIVPANDTIVFGLKRDRQKLYDRINQRVEKMFSLGFLDEVRSILDMGYSLEDPGLNTVGYKEAIAFLNDEMSREQMVKNMKTQTRRYAKRQLTWFRRWGFIHWLNLDELSTKEAQEKVIQDLAAKSNKD